MTGNELRRSLKKYAKRTGKRYRWDPNQGKGGHGTVRVGDRKATLPDPKKEIGKGLLNAILRQLDVPKEEI